MQKLLTLVIGALLLFGCGCTERVGDVEKIDGIVRVFMHEPGRFTLALQKTNSTELEMRTVASTNCKFLTDVPTNKTIWAKIEKPHSDYTHSDYAYAIRIEFHLHSARDLEGGAWNHGKNGRGQTQVLEE